MPVEDVKLEDLPKKWQDQINDLSARLPQELLEQILKLSEGEEQDVIYNKNDGSLMFLSTTDALNDPQYMRIGTIGYIDFSTIKDIVIHKAEGLPDLYEVNDGQNIYTQKDRDNLAKAGYKIKRTFVDSSIGDIVILTKYLKAQAAEEKWYSGLINVMIQKVGEELGIKKIPG